MQPKTPRRVLLTSAAVVGASTALLPSVTGYGTVLFQLVALGAWSIVAQLSSGRFADLHHGPVWAVAFCLNLTLFLIVAVPIYRFTRGRVPLAGVIALASWMLFYLGCLFVLFPATDGP